MGESRAISGLDRLPWLADDPAHRPGPRTRRAGVGRTLLWLVPLILAVAAVAYWLGAHSWSLIPAAPFDRPQGSAPGAESRVVLPEARSEALEPEAVEPAPQPEVAPARVPAMPTIRTAPRAVTRAAPAKPNAAKESDDSAEDEKDKPLTPWPVRTIDGSAGRLVRVGTFSSRREAKKAWWALMRINPALQRLPALVVALPSARDNKTYYRLQMGTTSQAHSVVLCQRMREIGQSCVVVPVPAGESA